MRFTKFITIFIIILFIVLVPMNSKVAAQIKQPGIPLQVFNVSQQDQNKDGNPDVTIIDCSYSTDHDRVLVYDQNGDMPVGNKWEEITDFQDDVWVFDASADGTAQLIVKFTVEGSQYTAFVYDDMNGDGQVSFHVLKDQVVIDESDFWSIKVVSDHPWTYPGGLDNQKITFSIDEFTEPGQSGSVGGGNDGIVDWQIEIGDKDGDGVNDYQLKQAVSPYLIQSFGGRQKATILVQVADRRPTPYTNNVFWPLLIGIHAYEDYRYFDHPPVISIDWQTGVIDQYGVLGYPIEAGYHIFSLLPLEKHTVSPADFENPMAYYDMANDLDGWPELQVRFDVKVPYDPYFPAYPYNGKVATPNLEVNISWDQNNDNRWDYKMNLISNKPVDQVVQFPDFAIKSIPYENIIPWVRNGVWDVAMLVFDGQPGRDSEGMFGKGWMNERGYANGKDITPSGLSNQYLVGFVDQPPAENYQDIQEFMRGEYNFQYSNTPKVYLGSLDHQLHLYSAQSGVWNLSKGDYIHYANLDGDAYIDQWQEQQDGKVVQQLNYSANIVSYSGNDRVILKQVDIQPSVFESPPPGNYEEWQKCDAQAESLPACILPDRFYRHASTAERSRADHNRERRFTITDMSQVAFGSSWICTQVLPSAEPIGRSYASWHPGNTWWCMILDQTLETDLS